MKLTDLTHTVSMFAVLFVPLIIVSGVTNGFDAMHVGYLAGLVVLPFVTYAVTSRIERRLG